MNSTPAIPDEFQHLFEKMWRAACRVCDNLLAFQPDVVIALMRSGWGPVFAAQALWQQTQPALFPPVARLDLGREKITAFIRDGNPATHVDFIGEYSSDIEAGRLLAWLSGREDWRYHLRQEVTAAMGTPAGPQRILVVDDCVHEGGTYMLTLGLLEQTYPAAQVRYLNAHSWYHSNYQDLLEKVFMPLDQVFPDGRKPSAELHAALGSVAVGSESLAEDSLAWQSISLDSPAVLALSVYRPAAEWLQASQAIYALIAADIYRRAAAYVPQEPIPLDFNYALRPAWRMMRDVWLEGGITRRRAQQRYNLSDQQVKRILEGWLENEDMAKEGTGRGMRYVLPLPLRRRLDETEVIAQDLRNAYWVLPDRLMFGEPLWYGGPQANVEAAHEEARLLLEQGIDCWLDVQIIREGNAPGENPYFEQAGRAMERRAERQIVPLVLQYVGKEGYIQTRRGRPNRKDIRQILDRIDVCLADGRVVYVSAPSDALRGILAGCYLARHGQAGAAALPALQSCRATGINGWKTEPASKKARRYVRSWPAGL